MYNWRKMSSKGRDEIVALRKSRKLPWHSPPHLKYEGKLSFIVTATCYEHKPVIGKSFERMLECEKEVLQTCHDYDATVFAWCVLPDHYHLLLNTDQIENLRGGLGLFHGRSSYGWNQEENLQGRKIWFRCFERPMKSERHFWTTMNYIHHNPVKHGYVEHWQDWPFSSAKQFLDSVGREEAMRMWYEYPVLDYGKGWDI